MKKQIILIAAITCLVAQSFGQNKVIIENVSSEVLTSVSNFDANVSNVNQLDGNRSNLQFYFRFEDGPYLWCITKYEGSMENILNQLLVKREFTTTPYYYNNSGAYSSRIALPLTSNYEIESCFIRWGKIVDAGFINNQSQTVSILTYNKVNNDKNVVNSELVIKK